MADLVEEMGWVETTDVEETRSTDPTGERYVHSNLIQLRDALRKAGLDICTSAERKVLEACAALDLGEAKLDEDGLVAHEVESIVEAEQERRG